MAKARFGQGWAAKLLFGMVLSLGAVSILPAASVAACGNEAVRIGPSAKLPDCRAYEMVSPPDSNGRRFGDVGIEFPPPADVFANELTSRYSDDSFLFETKASALPSPPGGNGRNDGDVYQALRTGGGWRTVRHVTPSGPEVVAPFTGALSFDHKYNFAFVPYFPPDEGKNGNLQKSPAQ